MYKVLIRPLKIEDASISWKWRNDTEIWKYTGRKPDIVVTEKIEKEWLLNKLKESNSYRFAIEVDNVYVGNIQLTNVIQNENAEYHIFIGDKAFWGRGIATLATRQIIMFAINVLQLKSIYLVVKPENRSAIKVYEKSGFEKINDKVEMQINLSFVTPPAISVFMMAYNHEKYIEEAIEGILMQKTTFDFDVVIGDDCSKDNTRKVLLEYQQRYPSKFKLLLHEQNLGAIANQKAVFDACKGRYIAICEGDDYWIDPYKLQKQVDFLEKNPTISMTFGNALIDDSTNQYHRKGKYINSDIAKVYNADSIFQLGLPTLTMVFRNGLLNFSGSKAMSGDLFLRLELSLFGGFYYHGEVFGVHRKHPTGISRTNNRLLWNINTAENLTVFKKKALKSQRTVVSKKIVKHWIHAFIWSLLLKKYNQSVSIFFNILFSKSFYTRFGLGTFKMLLMKVFLKNDKSILDIF